MIAPIFGREDSHGGTDYYIIFRNEDDTWREPINLGDKINSKFNFEWSPYVTRDGKYFFFSSRKYGTEDIFWMDAAIIRKLKKKAFPGY